jgi:hypothetical protein
MHRRANRNRHAATLLLFLATILATKKIQAQFDIEDSNSTASLRGIHNVGGGVAWASGTNGTVLRTEDGGYLWQTCTTPPGAEKLDFRGIQAFDENTAIVMSSGKGDLSRLYKTTDGCQTWKLLFTNPDKEGFWDAIQFATAKTQGVRLGVLVGDQVEGRFPIFLTFDEGNHWERQIRQSPQAIDHEAIFAASNSSLLLLNGSFGSRRQFVTGGPSGPRLLSLFIGRDDTCPDEPVNAQPGTRPLQFVCGIWSAAKLPAASTGQSIGAFSIAGTGFLQREVVVGGDYQKPDATQQTAWFEDKRFEWQAAQTPPHGYRSSVAYDPTQKLWITVGPNGTDISRDDGKNWTLLKPSGYDPPDADKNWNALSLPFVVGPHGRIGRLRTIPNPQK